MCDYDFIGIEINKVNKLSNDLLHFYVTIFTNINHSIMKYYSIKKVNINFIYYFFIHYQDFEQNTKLNLSRSYETSVIHLAVCCTY